MADSTHAQAGVAAPTHRPPLPGRADPCSAPARRAVVQLVEEELSPLVDGLIGGGAGDGTRAQPALADLIKATVDCVAEASESGRLANDNDLLIFRVLGARCGSAKVAVDDAVATVDGAAEAVRDLLVSSAHQLDEIYGEPTVDAVVAALCGVTEVVSRRAHAPLVAGHAAALDWWPRHTDWVATLCQVLDDPDEQTAAAAPTSINLVSLRSVAVFAGHRADVAERLQAAAHDAEVLLWHAVDAGDGRNTAHRRIVVEYRSHQDWRETTATLAAIARVHNLIVRTTVPAPSLRRLAGAYQVLLHGLPGYTAPSVERGLITAAAATA
jgi:hypothetical protein